MAGIPFSYHSFQNCQNIVDNIQRQNMSSSLQKRKPKKSLNNSLSEASNSENLRQSSVFKNDILLDIHNIQTANLKNSKRSHTSSTKRKPTSKVSEVKDSSNVIERKGSFTYTTFSKLVDEKNVLIATQQKQIENLKISLERLRREYETVRAEGEKKKVDDLAMLKRYERQNESQIKEIEKLKYGIRELKNRIEQVEQEKGSVLKKNKSLMDENEEITIRLAGLKEEMCKNIQEMANERLLGDLKDEVSILKDQAKYNKNIENQKKILENQCLSLEKKLHEYQTQCHELHARLNESEQKYYEAKNQLKDIKNQRDNFVFENKNLRFMMQEEKSLMMEHTEKLMNKLNKLEGTQTISLNSSCSSSDIRNLFNQLDEKFTKYESENNKASYESLLVKMKEKQQIIEITEQNNRQKCEEIKHLREKIDILVADIKQREDSLNEGREMAEKLQNVVKTYEQNNQQLNYDLDSKINFGKQLQMKAEELVFENERINRQHKATVGGMKIEYEKKTETLQLEISKLRSQIEGLHQEKEELILQLLTSQNKTKLMTTQIEQLNESIEFLNKEKNQMERQIAEKLSIIEKNIAEKKENFEKESERRQKSLKEKEDLLSKTNKELRQIKQLISSYKSIIENMEKELHEVERQLENETFMRKEEENKFMEELGYYKTKYEKSFGENLGLSEKICELQRESTEQLNKASEMIKKISLLEEEVRTKENQRIEVEKKINEQMVENGEVNMKLKSQMDRLINERNILINDNIKGREENEKLKGQLNQKRQGIELINTEKQNIIKECERNIVIREEEIKREHQKVMIMTKEEVTKVKNYNVEVSQQNQHLHKQVSSLHQELQQTKQKVHQYQISCSQLEKTNYALKSKTQQLTNQIFLQKQNSKGEIRRLHESIVYHQNTLVANEKKYKEDHESMKKIKVELQQELSKKIMQVEELSRELKKMHMDINKINKVMLDENGRKSRESTRQIENIRMQLMVVKEENIHLQQIMDEELQKRKEIIQELIKEKKILYEQLATKA